MPKRRRPRGSIAGRIYPDTPSGRGSRLYDRMNEAIERVPHAHAIRARLAWSFWGDAIPSHLDAEDAPYSVARFIAWSGFVAPIPPRGDTLADRALHQLAPTVGADEIAALRAFSAVRCSIYRVVNSTAAQDRFEVDDVVNGNERLLIHERLATSRLRAGNVLMGALHPIAEGWVMSGGMGVYTAAALPSKVPAAGNPEDFGPALERAI
jgi:hypothetical protein